MKKIIKKIKTENLYNIKLVGNKKNVYDYLFASDIYLTTSYYEGHPLSVLEAMGCGLPIIASDVVGNKDTIEHADSGFFMMDDFRRHSPDSQQFRVVLRFISCKGREITPVNLHIPTSCS